LKTSTIFCLIIFAIYIAGASAIAGTNPQQDGPSTPSQEDKEDNRTFSKSLLSGDSLDVPDDEEKHSTLLDDENESGALNETRPDFSGESDFYDDEDETSNSFISFNFLYYLLEKFKFTNSLDY